MPKISIKIPHVVSVIVMAGVGAFIGYFAQINPGSLITALAHWSTLEPILAGGAAAALATVLPLVQHSILVWETPPPVSGGSIPVVIKTVAIPSVPPARNERGLLFRAPRFAFVAALGASLGLAAEPACNPAQAQSALNAIENGISQFVTYVNTYLPLVTGVWATIAPFVGADVNTQFSNDVVAVEDTSAALQDALRAAQAAQSVPTPNYAELLGAVQDAVAKVEALFQQYAAGNPDAGVGDRLHLASPIGVAATGHQAAVIAGWKL